MSYILKFGKHKGESIEDISDNYLVWLKSIAKPNLKQVCIEEMARRFEVSVVEEPEDWHHAMEPLWDFGDR